jgi:prepilin-type N-terminal cleavage/methylation domain-containing protein
MKKLSRNVRAFTLVEIMIVVAIIALLAAVALPSLLRGRKRAQATAVLTDLRMIDAAIEQFALENNKSPGASVAISQWKKYVKPGTHLHETGRDIFNQAYGPQLVGRLPSVGGVAKAALADVVDDAFWSPYNSPMTGGTTASTASIVVDASPATAGTPPQ